MHVVSLHVVVVRLLGCFMLYCLLLISNDRATSANTYNVGIHQKVYN